MQQKIAQKNEKKQNTRIETEPNTDNQTQPTQQDVQEQQVKKSLKESVEERRRRQRESHRSTHFSYPDPIPREGRGSPKSRRQNLDALESPDSEISDDSNYCYQSNDDYLRALSQKSQQQPQSSTDSQRSVKEGNFQIVVGQAQRELRAAQACIVQELLRPSTPPTIADYMQAPVQRQWRNPRTSYQRDTKRPETPPSDQSDEDFRLQELEYAEDLEPLHSNEDRQRVRSPISALQNLAGLAGRRPTYFDCEEPVDSSASEDEANTTVSVPQEYDQYPRVQLPEAEAGRASDYSLADETLSQEHEVPEEVPQPEPTSKALRRNKKRENKKKKRQRAEPEVKEPAEPVEEPAVKKFEIIRSTLPKKQKQPPPTQAAPKDDKKNEQQKNQKQVQKVKQQKQDNTQAVPQSSKPDTKTGVQDSWKVQSKNSELKKAYSQATAQASNYKIRSSSAQGDGQQASLKKNKASADINPFAAKNVTPLSKAESTNPGQSTLPAKGVKRSDQSTTQSKTSGNADTTSHASGSHFSQVLSPKSAVIGSAKQTEFDYRRSPQVIFDGTKSTSARCTSQNAQLPLVEDTKQPKPKRKNAKNNARGKKQMSGDEMSMGELGNVHPFQHALLDQLMSGQQFGFGPPSETDHIRSMLHELVATATSQQASRPLARPEVNKEHEDKFYALVSNQVTQVVHDFEGKLSSVLKERESAIAILEGTVKQVFEQCAPGNGQNIRAKQGSMIVPVGLKQYGSQASQLAVDSSDVDLAVTGLKIGSEKGSQLREMRRLYSALQELSEKEGFICQLEIIESATVPLIKLAINLQQIRVRNRVREEEELLAQEEEVKVELPPLTQIDYNMVVLDVDITFDDYASSMQLQSQQQGSPFTKTQPPVALSVASLAIQSVYKIKELQLQYKDLRPIVMVVKKLLQKHDLNKPYHGGLNSYSIVLMTSTFLQNEGINEVSQIGCNLEQFFNFYGNYFDPRKQGLDGFAFFDLRLDQTMSNDTLWVLDISDSSNNTARSAFRFNEIQSLFSRSYALLEQNRGYFLQDPTAELQVIEQLLY